MAKSPNDLTQLIERLDDYGLVCFGGLEITANECAEGSEMLIGQKGLLIGNAGSSMWRVFSKSDEYSDGEPNPMNLWTKRILDDIAQSLGAMVVYPFDEPYWPFQRIAQKASASRSSPLGILIHPEYGLWHAFRGLVFLQDACDFESQISALSEYSKSLNHPCDSCQDKPCLNACPVNAFSGTRLDVNACFNHLDDNNGPDCLLLGCQARCACPIANERQYDNAQIQFHMKSYRGL